MYYYETKNWVKAQSSFSFLWKQSKKSDYLIKLAEIAAKNSKSFDITFLNDLDVTHSSLLWECYNHFNDKGDYQLVRIFSKKRLELEDIPTNRWDLYWLDNQLGNERFEELFLVNDLERLQSFLDFFSDKTSPFQSLEDIQYFTKFQLRVLEKLLSLENTLSNRRKGAEIYNYAGRYQMSTGAFKECEQSIRGGIALDPSNQYLYTNLAPAILLQGGRFEEAVAEYKKWMNKKLTTDDGDDNTFDTFREVFLEDLQTLEEEGVIPNALKEDVEKIRALLKGQAGEGSG